MEKLAQRTSETRYRVQKRRHKELMSSVDRRITGTTPVHNPHTTTSLQPNCDPSPNNFWNKGASWGVVMIKISLMPACIKVLNG
jgi:hypothetical protein